MFQNSFIDRKKENLLEDSIAKSKESIPLKKSLPIEKIVMENKEELVNVTSEKDSLSAEKDEDDSVVQDKQILDEKQSININKDDSLVDDEKTSDGNELVDDKKADYMVDGEEISNEKASFVVDKNDSAMENEKSLAGHQSFNDNEKMTHENNNIIKSPQMVFECVPIESGSEMVIIICCKNS